MATAIRAVLFDIGGVIADSPIMAIRRYCASIGMADINPFLGDSPAWNAYMRGAMARPEYDVALAAELEEASCPRRLWLRFAAFCRRCAHLARNEHTLVNLYNPPDDEAALTLALRRYVVVVASGDASLARGVMQRPEVVVRKMEAADSTQAKDAYIAAMGDDISIRKHAKRQCAVLDTLPAFVATLNDSIVGVVALDDQGEVRCLGVVPSL